MAYTRATEELCAPLPLLRHSSLTLVPKPNKNSTESLLLLTPGILQLQHLPPSLHRLQRGRPAAYLSGVY